MKYLRIILFIWFIFSPLQALKAEEGPNYHLVNINDTITIKRIPNDQEAISELVTYTLLAQTVILASTQAFYLLSIINKVNFLNYIKVIIPFLVARKSPRKDFSGLIYNSNNSKPIAFAVIRVVDASSGKVIKTSISDLNGRYGLLLNPGEYILEVQHQDYEFPVKDRSVNAVQNDNNSYFGDVFKVRDEIAVNYNIPMHPRIDNGGLGLGRIRNLIVNSSIFKLTQNLYFIYLVFLVSFLLMLNKFTWLLLLITIYYGIFTFLHIQAQISKLPKTWGRVIDLTRNIPIENIFIKFYNINGRLIDTKITDETGRFQLFLNDGEYYAIVQSSKYRLSNYIQGNIEKEANRIEFKVDKKNINLDIEMVEISENIRSQSKVNEKLLFD
jgi:hypothetical protein